jgi:general secretion pathway protein E
MERGMVTLRDDGWAKARAGVTTVEEIRRVTQEESDEGA